MSEQSIKYSKYCIYADWLPNYPANEHWEFVRGLARAGWEPIALSKLDVEKYMTNNNLIMCVTYDDLDITCFKPNRNNIIIYRLDDIFPYKILRDKCIRNADYICGPYMYLQIEKIYPSFKRDKSIWIPYSVPDTNILEVPKINNTPQDKVIVSGRLGPMYPFRNMMVELSKTTTAIDYLEHCGGYLDEDGFTHEITKDKYIKYLSNHLIGFTDGLIYQYVPLKVFEITAAGCLLLVDDRLEKPLKALGFIDGKNCILCNPENIMQQISWILQRDNRYKIDRIREAGQKLTYETHLTSHRISLFEHELYKKLQLKLFGKQDK